MSPGSPSLTPLVVLLLFCVGVQGLLFSLGGFGQSNSFLNPVSAMTKIMTPPSFGVGGGKAGVTGVGVGVAVGGKSGVVTAPLAVAAVQGKGNGVVVLSTQSGAQSGKNTSDHSAAPTPATPIAAPAATPPEPLDYKTQMAQLISALTFTDTPSSHSLKN